MRRHSHGIAALLAALLLALLSACGDGGGSDEPNAGGAQTGDGAANGDGGAADLESVDACSLLEPDEVRTFVEANREAVLSDTSVEISDVSAGTRDTDLGDARVCVWEVATFDRANQEACIEDGGSTEDCATSGRGSTLFRLGVDDREDLERCLVADDGLCVFLTGSYTDPRQDPPEMPPDLEAAVRARLTS